MEKLAQEICQSYNEINKTEKTDKIVQINIGSYQDKLNSSSINVSNEAVNFSNLDLNTMIVLFAKSEKLKNDYFKFGLYNMLDENTLVEFIKHYQCPYSCIESFLDFLVEKDNVNKIFFL